MVKTFESFKQEDYYTKLDWVEYPLTNHPIMKKIVDVSTDVFEMCKLNLNVCRIKKWFDKDYIDFINMGINGYIIELVDEYFVLFNGSDLSYWLCDQVEGLIKCMEDKLFIKIKKNTIKTFESFKQEDFYKEIMWGDFYRGQKGDDYESFSSDELDFIKSLGYRLAWYGRNKSKDFVWLSEKPDVLVGISFDETPSPINQVDIYKMLDEYFEVRIGIRGDDKFYRCDQFEGLKKLLEDIGLYDKDI